MKHILTVIAAAGVIAATAPAWAETNQGNAVSEQATQTAPGAGGVSKPGVAGLPGSKSGPSPKTTVGQGAAARTPGGVAEPSPKDRGSDQSSLAKQQDQSGVAGMPGNNSGPAAKPSINK